MKKLNEAKQELLNQGFVRDLELDDYKIIMTYDEYPKLVEWAKVTFTTRRAEIMGYDLNPVMRLEQIKERLAKKMTPEDMAELITIIQQIAESCEGNKCKCKCNAPRSKVKWTRLN